MIVEMTEAIVSAVHPSKIVLFGSRSRPGARPDSDVDLLVIEKEPFGEHRSRREEMHRIREALSPFRVSKDVLVYSEEEVAQWADSLNHVIAVALREGHVVYEGR